MTSAEDPQPGVKRVYPADFLTELFRNPLDPSYYDAAREPGQGRSGWPVKVASALILAMIGFLLAIAYRQVLADEPGRAATRAALVDEVNELQTETDTMQARADTLRAEVARQRDASLDSSEAARLRALEAATGLTRVTGDGVRVRIANSPTSAQGGTAAQNDLGRVYDRDLQNVANGLWRLGAEAVAINGQRLTATSTIRAAGEAILVDFKPVTGPYEVVAIGPEEMAEQFPRLPVGRELRAVADQYGMEFDIREADDLTLPAAAGPQLRHARTFGAASPAAETSPPGGD